VPGKQVISVNAPKVDNTVRLADVLRNLASKSAAAAPHAEPEVQSAHQTVATLAPQLADALEKIFPPGQAK
jgi:hypothetical protein